MKVAKVSDATFDKIKPLLDQGLSFSEALDQLLSVGTSSRSDTAHVGQTDAPTDGVPTSDSPFKPVCIWPGVQLWSRDADLSWIGEDFDCPIRLEDRNVTAAELSKQHCAKCPILAEHKKLLGVSKRRGVTIGERYSHLRGPSSFNEQVSWDGRR